MRAKLIAAVVIFVATALLMDTGCSRLSAAHLMGAACNGNTSKAESLLGLGANVNATDGLGNSALTLVEGCKPHDDPSRVRLVELLIAKGADINHRDGKGATALMYSAENGDTQAVNALLRNGAIVNIADSGGETALMKAAASSCTEETVKMLLNAGADLNSRDQKGRNALDFFRSSGACPKSKVGDLLERAAPDKSRIMSP